VSEKEREEAEEREKVEEVMCGIRRVRRKERERFCCF